MEVGAAILAKAIREGQDTEGQDTEGQDTNAGPTALPQEICV
jgi:hypothetical protein